MARNRDLRLDVIVQALDRGLGAVAAQIETVAARLEALDRQVARPRVEVDTDDATRNIGRFASDMQKRIGRAVKALPKIELAGDTDTLNRQLQVLRTRLSELSRQRIGVDVDADRAFANIQRISAELSRLANNRSATIQVRTDAAAALAELAAVKAAAESADRSDVDIEIRGHRSLRDWINGVSLLSRSLRTLVLPVAFLGALPTLLSMAGAVGQLAGAFGLLPGLLLGVGAAFGTIVLGLQGFEDAIKAADPEELAAALEQLTPSAQAAALAIRGLADAWGTVQDTVQENLFAGVAEQIQQLGNSYIPTLRVGLGGVATALNDGVQAWAEWAAGAEVVRDTGRIFEGIRAGIDNLAPGMRDLAAALTDIAVVSTGMFPRLAAGISEALGRFRDFIAQARDTGHLEMWIQRGIDAFSSLGSSIVNISSAFGGLSDAAEQALGGTFLANLEQVTQRFDEWVNSIDGQNRLVAFFQSIQGAVEAILPGLQSLGSSLLDAFAIAGPSVEIFATALSSVVTSLAPALPLVASLTSVVAVLATGFAGLLDALGPLPAILLAVWAAFRLLGTVGSLIGSALLLVSTGLTRVATSAGAAVLGLTASATAGQLVATTMTRIGTAFSATAAFMAGPWGAALLIAAGALLYFANSGAREAEARLAAVRAEAQSLQGTLDQLTGSITEATVQQRANNLAMDDYNETGRSTIETAQQFGIAANTVTQASLGNVESLRNVNTALVEHVTRMVESNATYQEMAPALSAVGISAQDLATAFLAGGDSAQQMVNRLQEMFPELSREDQALTQLGQTLLQGTESARQFAEHIGATGAALDQVIDRTIQAAAGAVNYEASLQQAGSAIEQFRGALDASNGSIIQGAEGAQQLSTALQQVSNDAQVTAVAAGIAAEANGTLADGVRAAGESMDASRAAFVAAAEAAGLGAIEAQRLADAMLLIPEVAEIRFQLRGAPEATQQIGEILAAMQALPDQKTFFVDALTDDAIAKLRELGFEVQRLDDGTYQITVTDNSEETRQRLQDLLNLGLSLPEAIRILVELSGADQALAELDALERRLNSMPPMPPIRPIMYAPDTGQFDQGLADARARAGEPLPIPQMDIDPAPGIRQISNVQTAAASPLPQPDFIVTVATALANIALVVAAAVALTLLPTPTLDVETTAATTKITALQTAITALAPLVPIPINVDTLAATTAITALQAAIEAIRLVAPIPIVLDTVAALAAVAAVRAAILALNSLTTTAHHTQTHNIPEVTAAILTLNSQATTAPHVQTHNVPEVLAAINTLNSANTTSTHTVSHNVSAVLAAINSLNGRNTSSTHTITTVHRTVGAPSARAAGGAVVRGFAAGGILPGYSPGRDTIPALLSPGESVLTPEATRLLGAKTIMGLNRMASGRQGVVLGRGALPGRAGGGGGGISGLGVMPGIGMGRVEQKLDELTTLLRTRDGVTINVAGSDNGDPQEAAQATKLALRTL